MPSVLLDTHILVWWRLNPGRLTKVQAHTLLELESRGEAMALSAISLWELAKTFERGRLEIPAPLELWLEEIETHPLIKILPLTARIVAESIRLGKDFHNDTADQIIVATARCHGLRLVTADERIRRWGKAPLV